MKSEYGKAIIDFEKTHKKYLNSDGSLNPDGWDYLHDAEVNWAEDIKWNDYIKFHMQPRIEEYWYGYAQEEYHDIEYKKEYRKVHPKISKELWG